MDLTPESFKRLLNWLHSDPEEAGREYERIRALLIKKFQSHDCSAADELADTTIDRVAKTLTAEEIENWVGKKEKKFFRVAYYILLEHRRLEVELHEDFNLPNPDKDEDSEPMSRCLEECLQTLPPDKRTLITRYYQLSKAEKIKNREDLARERDLPLSALRVKSLRIRKDLKCCIQKCLANTGRRRKTE
jgi:DNA-directed RNA polymerase specialized sigma24 family protein